MRTLVISCSAVQFGQAGEKCEAIVGEENARGHDEGQRDDVRRVFEHGAGTWDKRVRGDVFLWDALTRMPLRRSTDELSVCCANMKFRENAIKELIEKSGLKKNRLLCAKRTRWVRCVRGK